MRLRLIVWRRWRGLHLPYRLPQSQEWRWVLGRVTICLTEGQRGPFILRS